MKEYKVEGHISSYLPKDKNWKLVWADEFDGTELDRTKWDFRLNFWGKPCEAYTDEGIVLDGNSCIELHRVEKDGVYVSPQLQTGSNSFDIPKDKQDNPWGHNDIWPLGNLSEAKFVHRFGYYECRCKFQKHPQEMWSAFWTQSPSIGTSYDPDWCGIESDIMECFNPGIASTGNIMGGYGKQFREEGRVTYDLKETEDGFHTFGMDWREDGYTFYCDGKVISTADKNVSQVPQFILLTTEVHGHRMNQPMRVGETTTVSDPNEIGERIQTGKGFEDDFFTVDYVRVFDEVK